MKPAPLVLCAALGLVPCAQADDEAFLREILTPGLRTCEILAVEKPARLQELENKLRAAPGGKKIAWWDDVANAAPTPTPWRPSLGLTRKEYAELPGLYEAQSVAAVGAAEIRIGSRPRGVYVFLGEVKELNDITISVPTARASTPFGECGPLEAVDAHPGQKRVGKWKGFRCVQETPAGGKSADVAIQLSLGRLVDSDKLLIHYRAKRLGPGEPSHAETLLRCGAEGEGAHSARIEEPGWAVVMPGPFVTDEETVEPFLIRRWKTEVGGRTYIAGYQENRGVRVAAQEALDAYQSGFVGGSELKLQQEIEWGGYPGRRLHVSGNGVSHVASIYAVDQRVYLLDVVSTDSDLSFTEADRFFDTFRITPLPKPTPSASAAP
jgi:hypothetical protein